MYCKNRAFKSPAFNQWAANIFHKLDTEENLEIFKELREFFDEEKHGFIVNLKFFYPKDILYTKKGQLSAKCHDISNIEKPIIDLLFLPVYYKKPSPYGCKNLNIDDKYILSMQSSKHVADEHRMEIEIQIVSNNY